MIWKPCFSLNLVPRIVSSVASGSQSYRARFYNEDPRCTFCGNEETVEHLLFDCEGTEDRRKDIRQFIRENRIRQNRDILSGAGLNSDCADGLKLICKFLKDINRINLIWTKWYSDHSIRSLLSPCRKRGGIIQFNSSVALFSVGSIIRIGTNLSKALTFSNKKKVIKYVFCRSVACVKHERLTGLN